MNPLHALPALLVRPVSASAWPARSVRSNAILVLLGIELMLNAANLNFIAFWRFGPSPSAATGVIFVLFAIAVAAAEAAVGLALVIAVYRHQRNIRLQEATRLKG